jgi:streptomycin 6-kinase
MTAFSTNASLARVAQEVAADWRLELEAPFPAQYSYVAAVGESAVLKVQSEGDDESLHEAEALALWNGRGAVRILRHDLERRAMLLERALPGNDISDLSDETATSIAVGVGISLWQPAGEPFRWIGDHVPRWLEEAALVPSPARDLVPLARELFESLDVGRSTLVHGDLHHHNILDAGNDRYVAIDPKPMLGDPEFDVPPMLWNPITYEMTAAVTERRLAAFTAIGLDPWLMRAWSVIRGAYLRVDTTEVEILRSLI